MLRASKRIIVSTEAVNEYGFRVLTDGIDLSQYEKNPVMLYMHIRAYNNSKDQILPIGNVIELKIENLPDVGKVITGQPMFDDTDDFALAVYNKYENGTLRMASAGLKPKEWSEDPELLLAGQTGMTLAKSQLREISICDLGVNNESLSLALYDDNDNLINLSEKRSEPYIPQLFTQKIEMKLIQLSAPVLLPMLKLAEGATDAQVTEAIQNLVSLSDTQAQTINQLTEGKKLSDDKVVELTTKLEENIKLSEQAKRESLIQGAIDARKIAPDQKPHFLKLAEADYTSTEALLNSMTGSASIQASLSSGADDKSELEPLLKLSYDELFAKSGSLAKLKELDPNAYKVKFKEKFGTEPKN